MNFTILVDTAEQAPFTFQNLRADADRKYVRTVPDIEYRCLGRHPNSLGDYSLAGGLGRCHIERKSMEDCQSTILGFNDGHRERFECELGNLSQVECAMVLVECSLSDLLKHSPQYGKKTAQQNAKTLFRSVLAYQQDYRVPWLFCDGRGLAEQSAYWLLHRWWEKNLKKSVRQSARDKAQVGLGLSAAELLELV
jgi:hypothetical protein